MQVRAVKTFKDKKYGLVRAGMVLTVPTSQFVRWTSVHPPLVAEFTPPGKGEKAPGPSEDKSIPGAPATKEGSTPEKAPGKDSQPAASATPPASAKVGRKGGGRAKRSSSARADQA